MSLLPESAPARLLTPVCLLLLGACSRSSSHAGDEGQAGDGDKARPSEPSAQSTDVAAPVETDASARRWYRAVFAGSDGTEIPVYLALPEPGGRGVGLVKNGEQELAFDASWEGDRLSAEFPLYHARMTATSGPDGELAGTWSIESKTLGSASLRFRARRVDSPLPEKRFDGEAGDPIDLGEATTTWKADFAESGAVKIVLHQSAPGVFTASGSFPAGNRVYLAGNGRGDEIRLSTFEGLSVSLLTAKLDPTRKTMTGRWISGGKLDWREELRARRAEDFEVTLAAEATGRVLSMPQIARYTGKPLIVELGASWCPSCEHAARALKPLYERHHPSGLEIVSLTYEFTDDPAYNAKQAELFKTAHGLPWDVIPVDGSADQAGDLLPEAIAGAGFPVTIFLNRDGTIHAVQGSFAGPEEGDEHRRAREAYERHTAAIMAAPRDARAQ